MTPNDDLQARIADRYVAMTVAADLPDPDGPTLTIADLTAFLLTGRRLTPGQMRMLMADRRLRTDFDLLKLDLAAPARQPLNDNVARPTHFEMAAVAAASSGDIDDRPLQGGRLRIRDAGIGRQVYLLLDIGPGEAPQALLLEGDDGRLDRLDLDRPDADGKILMILDLDNDLDRSFVDLLRRPTTIGTFLS